MTTSDGVTLRHPGLSISDIHSRLDIDTISILSSQSDSIQHLSYNESDDEGKGLVNSNTLRLNDTINQTYQPSALKKDWIMYLKKPTNTNHNKHHQSSSDNESSSSSSSSASSSDIDGDDDESEQDFIEDPWTINTVQREYYTKQFQNLQKDITKVINGHIAKEFFERSNLPTSELSQIWNLSDVDHDGALSLGEFCTAMHLVVLRLNGFQLPDELPQQLQPFTPLIDLSDPTTTTTTDNWANFQSTDSPKQFTFAQPIADNHRIMAPVAVRLSPPPPPSVQTTTTKPPPPPPPRVPGRTASIDIPQQPLIPPRTSILETPQRNLNNNNSSTPYFYNPTHPSITSTSQQQSDPNILLEQIRDLLKPDHLQELSSIISTSTITNEQFDITLNHIKTRNTILKAHLKHWEDELTDLIDKRISLEHQLKLKHQ
ncbi:unnamed protein product [Rotaria sp. Silwood1]|nr:unnamed protein product [Rotaria sp. Silwood1]CAF1640992.1 unnamed protein product [Rotaria sp. Silwood1]CAF3751658.1 unnamed protein product [Rotaria sp. Silwood1]CAF3855052.1 unnamed protein product [Rotaria sp. Silwood1]CAF4643046.1 unnamed protein product [Rotaria sp. Silwood1]